MPSHSILSASGAHCWWNCAGSVSATSGAPREDSIYSIEGTVAHELASTCLTDGRDADQLIDTTIGDITVTSTMAAAVQLYVGVCRRLIDACDQHWIEHHFDLQALNPPVLMFGTADFIAHSEKRRELHVVDFKYGSGVWVAARNNLQLLYYAVGAVLAISKPVNRISMTVCQPRYGKGDPVRTATISIVELAEWSIELMTHARAALATGAPRVAGDWCRFCPAKNACLAFQNSRATAAYHEFSLADVHAAGA